MNSFINTYLPRIEGRRIEVNNYCIPIFQPEPNEVARVLRDGLAQNFAEIKVEWKYCPDLTQEPFNLAAPGLCGNTAILQFGGTGNMFPLPQRATSYNIADLIRLMKRPYINNFLLGGCICPRPSDGHLGELTASVLLKPLVGNCVHCKHRCYLASWDTERRDCKVEELCDMSNIMCNMKGNFFVSEGKEGLVLEVRAKKRIGLEFIEAMQLALYQEFGGHIPEICVGLGGTFVVKNAKVRHHVMPNHWYCPTLTPASVNACFHYFDINAPMVSVGMFTNTSELKLFNTTNDILESTSLTMKQFHTFHGEKGGYYHREVDSSDTVEYLGYFSLAQEMFILHPNINPSMTDISNVESC